MRSISPQSIIDELRKSGTVKSLRLADRMERLYKPRKDNIPRGVTMNLKTQLKEFIQYCLSADPCTEVISVELQPSDLGTLICLKHSHVPIETKANELKAISILLRTRPLLEEYAAILQDVQHNDGATTWQHIAVVTCLNDIEALQ